MYKDTYTRLVQTSVTVFIHCKDEYLFLKRSLHKRVDPGRLNGIGGKLESGENFLTCAVRETYEETGYVIHESELQLVTVGKLQGGYPEDWVMCFFKVEVPDTKIPIGKKTEDGELVWLHKDNVLDSKYNLIDDLQYIFKDIVEGTNLVFFTAQVNKEEKIDTIEISRLPGRNPKK